jgi:hypothetical protein
MKLARVEHLRCDDTDGVTYVMAPDGVDEDKFQTDVTAARELYQKAIDDFKALGAKPVWLTESLEDWPDEMTAGEIKQRVKENYAERVAYDDIRSRATHEFGYYLEKLGYTPLRRAECLEATAYWGHQHGVDIKYSKTTTDFKTKESEAAGQPEVYPLTRKALV